VSSLVQLSGKPRPADASSAGFRWYAEYGFRPFFLLSGLYALSALVAWVLAYVDVWALPTRWPPSAWHAHEMVFGFGGAAVAGFLLTAVPSWTNTKAVRGAALGVLVVTWLLGRAAMWTSAWLPGPLVAVLDLAHLPVLAWVALAPVARARDRRNYPFFALLAVLFSASALMHAQALGVALPARLAVPRLGVWVLVVMVTIVSGRIVPTFTRNYLRLLAPPGEAPPEVTTPFALEVASIVAVLAVGIADVLSAPPLLRGALGVLAALALVGRSARWGGLRSWRNPLVWILHLGHAWLVVAMLLVALAGLFGVASGTSALHALTSGAVGTMVLAVMSRASLGHTGRRLRASTMTVIAYLAVTLGASIRVFGPLLWPSGYVPCVALGGSVWALGFLLFVVVYTPVLTRPRPDGREG
jgi:uncharacterized protein involved in response to NO